MITMDNGIEQKRLSDFNLRALQAHVYPLTAEINHLTKAIARKIGAYRFGQEVGTKKYIIPVRLTENDELVAMEQMNNLNAFLFDGNYQARPLKLIFDSEPDKHIQAFVAGALNVSRDFIRNSFNLSFVAFDPRKYSNVYNDDILWGSEIITFGSFYLLGHENPSANMSITEPKSVSVTVIGQAVKPTIEITGSATNLVITANGKAITVGTFTDDVWTIECDKYISYQNGVEKMIDMGNFILTTGNNAVSFAGTGIDITVSIKFRDKWL